LPGCGSSRQRLEPALLRGKSPLLSQAAGPETARSMAFLARSPGPVLTISPAKKQTRITTSIATTWRNWRVAGSSEHSGSARMLGPARPTWASKECKERRDRRDLAVQPARMWCGSPSRTCCSTWTRPISDRPRPARCRNLGTTSSRTRRSMYDALVVSPTGSEESGSPSTDLGTQKGHPPEPRSGSSTPHVWRVRHGAWPDSRPLSTANRLPQQPGPTANAGNPIAKNSSREGVHGHNPCRRYLALMSLFTLCPVHGAWAGPPTDSAPGVARSGAQSVR
jgi:hypothetical protein